MQRRNYSYDPFKANEPGLDRMRLELGDTTFAPGELTAALCDEEYVAILSEHTSWKKAKVHCLKVILMKYAHQTSMSVDGLSYNFSDRVKLWREMLDEEEKKSTVNAVPTIRRNGKTEAHGGHYFRKNLHSNPRKW